VAGAYLYLAHNLPVAAGDAACAAHGCGAMSETAGIYSQYPARAFVIDLTNWQHQDP